MRVVARDGARGQIALTGSQEQMHEAADTFLRKECQGAYTLLDEQPTAEGEWRISYRCEANEAAPQAKAETSVRF